MSRTERRAMLWIGFVLCSIAGAILLSAIGYILNPKIGGYFGLALWVMVMGALMMVASYRWSDHWRD